MSHLFFLLLCILKLALVSECAGWSRATSRMIRADDRIAVGAYNGSIYLVGGASYMRQITEYQIDTKTFIDIGSNVLSSDALGGWGQSWTQKYETMYIITSYLTSGTIISTFNMITRQYTANWANIPKSQSSGCLAISNDYLFVVGGYMNTLQALNLLTNQWLSNPPSMNAARASGACIAYYGYVWAFAGAFGGSHLSTNERINITDITSNQWSYIDPLTHIVSRLRAVSWQGFIFTIAGYKAYNADFDTVHIIDAVTGSVTLSPQRLVYAVSSPGVILTDNIIYVFGGWEYNTGYKDTWMQYDLLNQDITTTPRPQTSSASVTNITTPTEQPSDLSSNPTVYPSLIPTSYPSFSPSNTSQTPFIHSTSKLNQTPSYLPSDFQSTEHTLSETNSNVSNSDLKNKNVVMIIVWSVIGCLVICAAVTSIILYFRKKKQQRETNQNMMQMNNNVESVNNDDVDESAADPNDDLNIDNIECEENKEVADVAEKKEEGENELDLIRVWLASKVGLAQYFELFIKNGYDSLQFISEITDSKQLLEIGITMAGHRTHIMSQIGLLRSDHEQKHGDSSSENSLWEPQLPTQDEGVEVTSETNMMTTIDNV